MPRLRARRMSPRLLPCLPLIRPKPKERRWPHPTWGIGRTMTFWSISRKRSLEPTKRTATNYLLFMGWRSWLNRPKRSFFDPWPLVTTATSCVFPPRSRGQHRVPNRLPSSSCGVQESKSCGFLSNVVAAVELGNPVWASDEKSDRMANTNLRLFLKGRKELSLLMCLNQVESGATKTTSTEPGSQMALTLFR